MLIKMFQSAIDNDDEEKLKAFVGTLTLEEDDYYTKVKIRANNIIVSGGKLVQISCKADILVIERRRLISQKDEMQLPEGIDWADSVQ